MTTNARHDAGNGREPRARRCLDCLVLTPVGPRSQPAYVADTIESFRHYMPPDSSAMLLLDDSRSTELKAAIPDFPNVRWISSDTLVNAAGKQHNTRGLLLVKQMRALAMLEPEFSWNCLLRLDDDALFIGPSPHRDALEYFAHHPSIGMLGAYLRRGDGTDKTPALAKQARRLLRQIVSRAGLRHPRMSAELISLIVRAKRHGYSLGHMCTGGALFLSGEAYEHIADLWKHGGDALQVSGLADDLLLALYTHAAGFRLADFSDAEQVMAINYRGLPMPLEELVRRRKKIVHPVKEPSEPEHEARVRAFFREQRGSHPQASHDRKNGAPQ